ncbi:NAD(P)H-dependent oxidoreductase [Loktanella sp. SALINAS62]|uniref:NAD(P)H-dependent oxidoreductase n=1 Tax=Loktanella sp. SALINAS62 TaxID=2706124 RepID=UPI001B8AE192|nr:NAD(P)H-dependent oxidoreductase [Loktanella sp. SALINAS62]MBS1302258.1 NAD(P)H-dependent oxidoreductase [Loktanella sp. SALINAS62]
MTTTLIVLAHPDARSFNGVWADATQTACEGLGDTVLRSDLVSMGFDPVERASHYPHLTSDTGFDALKAQENSAALNCLPTDVEAEIEKLRRADRVVFHFPIWWFAPPAILKGWFDRVLAHGALHSVDQRFDAGQFRSKKALFCVTTGSKESESAFDGKEGDIQMLLWPAAYTLRYLGFSVAVPEIIHGVHGYNRGKRQEELEDRLAMALDAQVGIMTDFASRPVIPFNADSDFDANGRLQVDRPNHSYFIRKAP